MGMAVLKGPLILYHHSQSVCEDLGAERVRLCLCVHVYIIYQISLHARLHFTIISYPFYSEILLAHCQTS